METGTKFYCKTCKTTYPYNETIIHHNIDNSQKQFLCPKCKNKLIHTCLACNGLMIKPEKPILGDYNEDGFLECFCNTCGCGFIHIYGTKHITFYISKREIKRVIDKIFTIHNLDYRNKKDIQQKIFNTCKTKEQIINILSDTYNENKNKLNIEIKGFFLTF